MLDAGRYKIARIAVAAAVSAWGCGRIDFETTQVAECPQRCASCERQASYPSCEALSCAEPAATSGVFELDPDGDGGTPPFPAYCEMSRDGGFTLVLKADGLLSTFVYDSTLWEDDQLLNPDSTNLEEVEAKLDGYSSIAFSSLRVGMSVAGDMRWLTMDLAATSLREAMQRTPSCQEGPSTSCNLTAAAVTAAGRDAWLALVPGSGLQTFCNREGIKLRPTGGVSVRIGILGNNEDYCTSCDSWLGIGAPVFGGCSTSSTTTSGNSVHCDLSPRDIPAFAFVMVR